MPQYNDDLRIRQVTVCYGNGKGNLKGFQFRIGGSSFVNLPLVGKRGIPSASTCDSFEVNTRVTKIETSMKNDGSFVNAIAFHIEGQEPQVYGTIDAPLESWEFQENKPLIGLYGKANADEKIE